MNDPIGDFIIRIKNAQRVKKDNISVNFSRVKMEIAELLKSKGFVVEVMKKNKGEQPRFINIKLAYDESGQPMVNDVQRVSKPSRRLYIKARDVKKFRRGFGMTVISTPKGIMADMEAKRENLGGEILFNIW